ncbi:MAG: autotransporter domain-containing protein [Neisseriaceae bacterium]|nr:MAG: autotransporter domain-containing protein [Neisseriaceae bacterium]
MKIRQKQLVLSLVSLFGAVSLTNADGVQYRVAHASEPVIEENPVFVPQAVEPELEVSEELACVEDEETCQQTYYPLYLNLLLAAADLALGIGSDTRYDPKIEYSNQIDDVNKRETNFTYNPADFVASPVSNSVPLSLTGPLSLGPATVSLAPSAYLSMIVPSVMSSNASLAPLFAPLLSSLAPFNLSASLSVEPLLSSITPLVTSSTSGFLNPSQPSSGPSNSLLTPLTSSSLPLFSLSTVPLAGPSSSSGTSLMSLLAPSLTSSSLPSMPFSSSLSVSGPLLFPSTILPSYMLTISLAPLNSSIVAPSLLPYSLSIAPLNISMIPLYSLSSAPLSVPSSSLSILGPSSLSPSSSAVGLPLLSSSLPVLSSSSAPSALPSLSLGSGLQSLTNSGLSISSAPLALSVAPLSSIPPSSLSMDPSKSLSSLGWYSVSAPLYSLLSPLGSSLVAPSLFPLISSGTLLASLSIPLSSSLSGPSFLPISLLSSVPPFSLSMDPSQSVTSGPLYSSLSSSSTALLPFLTSLAAPVVMSSSGPVGSLLSSLFLLATLPIWGPFWASSSLPGLSSLPFSLPSGSSGLPVALSGLSSKSLGLGVPSLVPMLSSSGGPLLSVSLGIPSSLSALPTISLLFPSVSTALSGVFMPSVYLSTVSGSWMSAALSSIPSVAVLSLTPSLLFSASSLLTLGLLSGSLGFPAVGLSSGSSLIAPLIFSSSLSVGGSSIPLFMSSSVPVSLLGLISLPTLLSGLSFGGVPMLLSSALGQVSSLVLSYTGSFLSSSFATSAGASIATNITSSSYPLIGSFVFVFGAISGGFIVVPAIALSMAPVISTAPSIWGGGISTFLGGLSSVLSVPFLSGSVPSLSSAPIFAPVGSSLSLSSVPFLSSGLPLSLSGWAATSIGIVGSTSLIIASAWFPIAGGLSLGFSSMPWIWYFVYMTIGGVVWISAILTGDGSSLFSSSSGSFLAPLSSSISTAISSISVPLSSSSSLLAPLESSLLPLVSSNPVTSGSFSILAPSSLGMLSSVLPSLTGFIASSTASTISSSSALLGGLSAIPSSLISTFLVSSTFSLPSLGSLSFSSAFLSSISPLLPVFSSALGSATSIFGLSSIPASVSVSLFPSVSSVPLGSSSAVNYILSSTSSVLNSVLNIVGVTSSSLGVSSIVPSSLSFPLSTLVESSLGSLLSTSLVSLTSLNVLTTLLSSISFLNSLSSGTVSLTGGISGASSVVSGLVSSGTFLPSSSSASASEIPSSLAVLPGLSIATSGSISLLSSFLPSSWLTSAGSIPGSLSMGAAVAGAVGVYYLSTYGSIFFILTAPIVSSSGLIWPVYMLGSASFPVAFPSSWSVSVYSAESVLEGIFSLSSIPSSWNPFSNGSSMTAPSASLMTSLTTLMTSFSGVPLGLLSSSSTLPTSGLVGLYVTVSGLSLGYVSNIGASLSAVPIGTSSGVTFGPIAISSVTGGVLASSLTVLFSIGSASFIPFSLTALGGVLSSVMVAFPALSSSTGLFSLSSGILSIPTALLSVPFATMGSSISLVPVVSGSIPTSLLGISSSVTSISSSVGNSITLSLLGSTSVSYSLSSLSNFSSLLLLPSLSAFPSSFSGLVSLIPSWASSSVTGSLGNISSSLSILNISWSVPSSLVVPSSVVPSSISSGLSLPLLSISNPLTALSTFPLSSIIGPISSGLPSYLSGLSLFSLGSSLSAPLASNPSSAPSSNPSSNPSSAPFSNPSLAPFSNPSLAPISNPLLSWFSNPSVAPSVSPPSSLSTNPSSMNPSSNPSTASISNPSLNPSSAPFSNPALSWLSNPSSAPLSNPSSAPSSNPSLAPSFNPLTSGSVNPSLMTPSTNPSTASISNPSLNPSSAPLSNPSMAPLSNPSSMPLSNPLSAPLSNPSLAPISNPSSGAPSTWSLPSSNPSSASISNPSINPISAPSSNPSSAPISNPSLAPFSNPSSAPISNPSLAPFSNPLISSLTNPSSQLPSSNPLASSSNPSLNPSSAPLSNPLLSSSSNPSSAPLFNPLLSLFSNPSLAPFSNPISSSSNPLLWPSSGPLSISSNPLSSSISNPVSLSSNPLSTSIPSSISNPSSWSNLSSALPSAPSAIVAGPAMSSKFSGVGNKKANRASYYIPGYDFTETKKDFEFRNVVTFGDSLSDTGSAGRGGIYMADGNPFSFYNSYLGIYLTGKFNAPRSQNGTNYAVSGALVKWASSVLQLLGDPIAVMRSKMSQQIEYYLQDNKQIANSKDVFVLWGGGNDMTGDIMQAAMPWNWDKILTSAGGYLDNKPKVLGGYAQLLADKGAKNIFMLGLPDPGLSPFSGAAIVGATVGSLGMFMDGTPLEFLNPGNWVLGAMDSYLRNNNNLVGTPVGNADEYVIDNYARMYNHFMPLIPKELWRWVIVIPSQLQRNLVLRWNRDLQERLMDVNGNIVYADIYRLYEEVQNDPYTYGFTNILVAQCSLGKESTICDAGDDYYHGDDGQVYMYTDWHHPSPQMNQIIAEYLLSIFNAPGYVSGLSRVSEVNESVRNNFMKNEMKYMRFDTREVGEFRTFASILTGIDKNSRSLSSRNLSTQGIGAGFAYRASEGLDVGASLSLMYGDKHPSNQLKYKDSAQALTAFMQYKDASGLWANGQVYTGWEQMSDIKRSMQFLKHIRTEKGATKGKVSGFGASVGYDVQISELGCDECSTTWYATPYIEGSVTKFKVKGYEEEGNSSTAMEFNEQKRTNKLGTLGVQFSSRSPKLNTNLDIAYTKNFDYEEFEAEGRLKNFAKNFHRSGKGIAKERKGWLSITPSVEYKINDEVSVYGNVNYNYGNSKFTQLNGTLGIRSKF